MKSKRNKKAAYNFIVGQKVVKENSRKKTRKGDKLSNRWICPYIVSEQLRKGTYKGNKLSKEN